RARHFRRAPHEYLDFRRTERISATSPCVNRQKLLKRDALDHEPSFRAHAKLELGDPRGRSHESRVQRWRRAYAKLALGDPRRETTQRPSAAKAQSTCQAGAWRSQGEVSRK